jgi:hypothetical protein
LPASWRTPLWVNRVGLTLCQPLLVYPDQRTSIALPGCQVRTSFGIFGDEEAR